MRTGVFWSGKPGFFACRDVIITQGNLKPLISPGRLFEDIDAGEFVR